MISISNRRLRMISRNSDASESEFVEMAEELLERRRESGVGTVSPAEAKSSVCGVIRCAPDASPLDAVLSLIEHGGDGGYSRVADAMDLDVPEGEKLRVVVAKAVSALFSGGSS